MTRPLRSARITGPQRYYETVRPRAPRRYSAPHGDGRLGISLSPPAQQADSSIGATGSHVPCKSPGQARAAYMPDAIWAVSRLPPDLSRSPGHAPVSTPLRKLTTRQQRFAFARLPDPHLTRSSPRLFRSAHHERHLTDAACGGLRPPPAGRPRRTYLHLLHSTASGGFYIRTSFSVRGTRPGDYPAAGGLQQPVVVAVRSSKILNSAHHSACSTRTTFLCAIKGHVSEPPPLAHPGFTAGASLRPFPQRGVRMGQGW